MNTSKDRYIQTIGIAIVVMALVRCAVPDIAGHRDKQVEQIAATELTADTAASASPATASESAPEAQQAEAEAAVTVSSVCKPHRVMGVQSYTKAFPDSNSVQLVAARHWGVTPVKNREDAEMRKRELVFIDANPYYCVAPLRASIPYLVPEAALLLQDIGRAFYDSLDVKGLPLHQIIVTSVLRTEDDVRRLRRHNTNATENSCHLYGTTFDIAYNRYVPLVEGGDTMPTYASDGRLKFVLSEVLRDMRESNRCFVKYEVKQGCFHLTVR